MRGAAVASLVSAIAIGSLSLHCNGSSETGGPGESCNPSDVVGGGPWCNDGLQCDYESNTCATESYVGGGVSTGCTVAPQSPRCTTGQSFVSCPDGTIAGTIFSPTNTSQGTDTLECGDAAGTNDAGGPVYCCTPWAPSCTAVSLCPSPAVGFNCNDPVTPDQTDAGLVCAVMFATDDFASYCCVTGSSCFQDETDLDLPRLRGGRPGVPLHR